MLDICNNKLGIAIGPDYIGCPLRLGAPDSSDHNDGARYQPIIVKFTAYRAHHDNVHGHAATERDDGGT